jgi:drug/metabolite transporter (DMT)-like permease
VKNKGALYGTLVSLAGAALWGLNAVVSKYLMGRGIDTMWMVNFRMITAGAVLLLFAFIKNRRGLFDIWKDRASIIRLLVIAVFAFGIKHLCKVIDLLQVFFHCFQLLSAVKASSWVQGFALAW